MPQRSNGKLSDAEMASLHRSERREERFPLSFDIEVSGIDSDGGVFHFATQTRNVSEWGCGFYSPKHLRKDDIVAVRVASPETPGGTKSAVVRFQVVRVEQEAAGWDIGAWKIDSGDTWGIELDKLADPLRGAVTSRRLRARDRAANESEKE